MVIPTHITRRMRSGPGFQHGLSLIEILVGVAIGLIGIVMMFQLLENWESRKRTTAAGSDAQISGSIAAFKLGQDIRQAGYGFGTAGSRLACTVNAYDVARVPTNFSFPLLPVQIVEGAAGLPDTVVVLHSNSSLLATSFAYSATTTTSKKTKDSRVGLRRGDLVIAVPASGNCGLIRITDNNDADGYTINHVNGTYTDQYNNSMLPSKFNDPAGFVGAATTGTLYVMGDSPNRDVWQITGRALQARNDLLNGATEEAAEGIVNLQAQYGIDTDADDIVDTWTNANVADPATLPIAAAWSDVRAVRFAILARSQQYEKLSVTVNAPSWSGGAFTMTNVDGSADSNPNDPNNWRRYRYRLYESTIPLRNMVWSTMP